MHIHRAIFIYSKESGGTIAVSTKGGKVMSEYAMMGTWEKEPLKFMLFACSFDFLLFKCKLCLAAFFFLCWQVSQVLTWSYRSWSASLLKSTHWPCFSADSSMVFCLCSIVFCLFFSQLLCLIFHLQNVKNHCTESQGSSQPVLTTGLTCAVQLFSER